MNTRTKAQFKTWQRLPELPATGARPVPGRGGGLAGDAAAAPSALRQDKVLRTGNVSASLTTEGARSPMLKFIFTTHD